MKLKHSKSWWWHFEHLPFPTMFIVGVAAGGTIAVIGFFGLLGASDIVGLSIVGGVILAALGLGSKARPVIDRRWFRAGDQLLLEPTSSDANATLLEPPSVEETFAPPFADTLTSPDPAPTTAPSIPEHKIIPPVMVDVDGGTFWQGASEGDDEASSREQPRHQVSVDNFSVGKFVVTRAQYRALVDEIPEAWGTNEDGDLPATNLNWFESVQFCNRLSEQAGLEPAYVIQGESVEWLRTSRGYRLPTEAEWEMACRGGTDTPWFCSRDNLGQYAWYQGNSNLELQPVGQKRKNPAGLYDIAGNVWEWCWDWFAGYSEERTTNPAGPLEGESRILRGGSAFSEPSFLRSSDRFGFGFGPSVRDLYIGFRCARSRRQP